MKYSTILLMAIIFVLPACKKNHNTTTLTSPFSSKATIIGRNPNTQDCGGFYYVEIQAGPVNPIPGFFYPQYVELAEFDSVPAGCGINLATATFPVSIEMNWHRDANISCDTMIGMVTIDSLQKIN